MSRRTSASESWRDAPGDSVASCMRTDARAHESRDVVTHRGAHPTDLAVAPLVDHDAQQALAHPAHLGRTRHAVVELDALAQTADRRRRRVALDAREVLLGQSPSSGASSRCARRPSLVRIKQTFGVHVETPDGKNAHRALHEVQHGRAPLGVGRGRDDAVGLVEQEVDLVLAPWAPARRRRRSPGCRGRRGCPVARRARRWSRGPPDEDLAGAPRPESRARQGLLQALALVQLRDLGAFVDRRSRSPRPTGSPSRSGA